MHSCTSYCINAAQSPHAHCERYRKQVSFSKLVLIQTVASQNFKVRHASVTARTPQKSQPRPRTLQSTTTRKRVLHVYGNERTSQIGYYGRYVPSQAPFRPSTERNSIQTPREPHRNKIASTLALEIELREPALILKVL